MVAEEMREYMAAMGFRSVDDMVGRADMLEVNPDVIQKYPRLAHINLDKILLPARTLRPEAAQRCVRKQVSTHLVKALALGFVTRKQQNRLLQVVVPVYKQGVWSETGQDLREVCGPWHATHILSTTGYTCCWQRCSSCLGAKA